jgi:hypothetical protein
MNLTQIQLDWIFKGGCTQILQIIHCYRHHYHHIHDRHSRRVQSWHYIAFYLQSLSSTFCSTYRFKKNRIYWSCLEKNVVAPV